MIKPDELQQQTTVLKVLLVMLVTVYLMRGVIKLSQVCHTHTMGSIITMGHQSPPIIYYSSELEIILKYSSTLSQVTGSRS